MKQKKILGLALIFVFVLSVSANSNLVVAQTNIVTTNFELSFFLPSGSRRDESYGLYIKQALAPLGIDVKIFAKPWGQFVGDLLRSGLGKPFDMATVGFAGGGQTPDFGWLYHSEGYWGGIVQQLGDSGFQEWQMIDVELNQTVDIDPLIDSIDFELNLTKRYELFTKFNDMYFTKLLWNMPLIAQATKAAMWKGFGGANNEMWDTKEGVIPSSFLGAAWDAANTPDQRSSNTSTIRWAVGDQGKFNLDPFQVQDTSQGTQTDWSYVGGFLQYDGDWAPHPNTAWNFFHGNFSDFWDDDFNATTPEVSLYQYTFLLRDDVYWHETVDMNGKFVDRKQVTGLDYLLTLEMYNMSKHNEDIFTVNGIDTWEVLADWEVSTTLFTDDTITLKVPADRRTPDDLINFGWLNPLPSHLLGGDLTYYNSTSEENMTSTLNPDMTFSPWDSFEWNSFESFEGNTAVGPYQMVDYEFNVFHSFAERDDFWFPNEWDIAYFNGKSNDALKLLESTYNTDFSLWGNGSLPIDAYYYAYAEVTGDKAKPSKQNLETIEYVVIADQNAELIKFEAGDLDIFGSTQLGASTVASHENNDGLVVKDTYPNSGARLLFFNLLHEDLKKINVRLAIAHALDRDKLVNIHDGFGIPWWNLAYSNKISGGIDWDSVQHPLEYNYSKARDYMREELYQAADTNDFIETAAIPDVKDIIDVLGIDVLTELVGSELLFLFSSFAMISVILIRKRK